MGALLLGHASLAGLWGAVSAHGDPWIGTAWLEGGFTLIRLTSNTENNVKSLIKLRFKRKFRPQSFTPKVLKISL